MQKLLFSFVVVFIGSIAVAATIFFKQADFNSTNAQATQPTVASCQTGFARPLIFGISSTHNTSGYGPLGDKEGGLIKAGSTLATVSINWDHDSIQGKGPQDYNPESVNFPIRKAVQTGRVVVVNISGTPRWATGNPELLNLPDNRHGSTAQPNKADATVNKEFKELVIQAVRDNKDKVKYWTYWNEPNGCMSSKGECGYTQDSLEDFAYWHKVFYDTVKAEDPSAKIIFGNLDFTGPNTNFIRDVHRLNYKIEYDYLGLNVYNKSKNAKFPIEWAKAGYDAQPSNYKKPVWINEWGFDTIWWGCGNDSACKDRARQDIAPLVEDGLNKIRDNDWIYAAQYHHLRDSGGGYGLWNNSGPRPGGTKFLELVNNRCNPTFSSGTTVTPPPVATAACVVSSHDLGGDFLKKGQPITLTSVASQPVKTFKYTFYNSDNKNAQGIAQPICISGSHTAGNCRPMVVEVNGANNFEGAIQAAAWLRLPNGKVVDSIWRGNLGWNRTIEYNQNIGTVDSTKWNFSNYLGIENFNTFRSTSEIDALDFYAADSKTGYMEIWRNNIGKRTEFSFNAAGDYPDWGTAKTSDIANLNTTADKSKLPGDGVITAAGSFIQGGKLWQIHWRGNTEWIRSIPIANGKPNFAQATAYTQGRTTSNLPVPNVKVQAVNFILMPNNTTVQEQIWIDNKVYLASIPASNNNPQFTASRQYTQQTSITNMTQNSNLTDSTTLTYDKVHVVDTATGKIPQNIQINATFSTEAGEVRDDGKCVMRFAFAPGIDGDVDGNCVTDIYDYNLLVQHYNTDNCQYNIAGNNGCRIDNQDIQFLQQNFGKSCAK